MKHDLREQFHAGTSDFRPIPFWFWNNDLSEESLLSSLQEMTAKGINEVLIHPRTGMTVGYFSDLFWERIGFALKEAAARGIKVWLYDEFNWPSGAVGGQLLAAFPQYMMRVLNVETQQTTPGQEIAVAFPGQFLAAFEIDTQSGKYTLVEGHLDPPELSQNTDFFPASAAFFPGKDATEIALFGEQPANLYPQQFCVVPTTDQIMVFSIEINRTGWAHTTHQKTPLHAGFLDKLNPQAVQHFIEMTHDAYYQRFADYFGTTIVGIFTDEPAAWAWPNHFEFFEPARASSLAWSQHLLERFEERYGFSLVPHLPELVADLPNAQQTRYAFWQLANDMYREAYFQPIAQWCEQRGVAFTGHLNTEEAPQTLIRYETGIFNNLRDMQIPGYDFLSQEPGYEHPELNFSAKLVSSIAHAFGRERVMCEIFGASGWQTSLADCRRTLNWIMASGISLLTTHGHYLSIQGMRKRDYPPSHSRHEPWWRYYEHFSQYSNRVGLLTTYGTYQGDIAILYSFGNQWMRYSPEQGQQDAQQMNHERFVALMIAFLRHQHDFDFVFDEQFTEGLLDIRDGQLIAPGATYRLLVIPPVEYLPRQVAQGVVAYARSGGRILLIGAWPTTSEKQARDPLLIALGQELERMPKSQVLQLSQTEQWSLVVQQVVEILEAEHPLPVKIHADARQDCIMMYRRDQAYELTYLANVGKNILSGTVQFLNEGNWEIWNPEDGMQYRLSFPARQEGPHTMELLLQSGEARCFVRTLSSSGAQEISPLTLAPEERSTEQRQFVTDLSDGWTAKPLTGNMYAPATWEARLAEGTAPWVPFSPLREFWPKPTLPRDLMIPGALCQFRTMFCWEGTTVPGDLQIVLEQEREQRVWLNGEELLPNEQRSWLWDDSNRAYSIAHGVRPGANQILVEQRWPDYLGGFHPPYATLEPIVVHGSFRVDGETLHACTSLAISQGSWHTQGFPHYIGLMEYQRPLFLKDLSLKHHSLVFEGLRETAEVWINDTCAGVRTWEPFAFDLTGLLQVGENELRVMISNTAANLLQPGDAQPCGILGKVFLYGSV